MRKIFLILAVLFTALSFAQENTPDNNQSKSLTDAPPVIKKYVVDETGTLSASQKNSLMTKLVDFEKATSNQIIVYIIPTLNGEPIENVAVEIARKNKIGKKDKNNGALLLIAMNDRKMRIEVGYGLEGALTDALSSQIIRKDLQPNFKAGRYYEGIDKAIDDMMAATKGEFTGDGTTGKKKEIGGIIFVIFIFIFIFFVIIISIIKRIAGAGRGMVTGKRGSRFGDVGTGFLIGSLFNSLGSGSDNSSSSGSGSDFGGFSGGGGDFGGGGASGDW